MAHAYAARSGTYSPLAVWRREAPKDGAGEGVLVGKLEMPMALGTVGGTLRVHPAAVTAAPAGQQTPPEASPSGAPAAPAKPTP